MLQRQKLLAGILVVASLVTMTLPVLGDELRGRIASINVEKNTFAVAENVKNWNFQLAKGGSVFINDRESRLSELKAGDEAVVTYTRDGERLTASSVRCSRK